MGTAEQDEALRRDVARECTGAEVEAKAASERMGVAKKGEDDKTEIDVLPYHVLNGRLHRLARQVRRPNCLTPGIFLHICLTSQRPSRSLIPQNQVCICYILLIFASRPLYRDLASKQHPQVSYGSPLWRAREGHQESFHGISSVRRGVIVRIFPGECSIGRGSP